jgi:uncharacterized protein YukE
MPTQIEKEIDVIETRMAELAGEVKKEEELFKARLVKGKAVIEKIADTPARLQAQAFFNYLSGWTSKLEASRKLLDQTGVLIKQDDGFLVVDQMDDQVRHLIKRAEELGGVVTEVQKVPKQELLL